MSVDREDRSIAMQVARTQTDQPVAEVARQIVDGHVFTDLDAIRVARAYLAEIKDDG